MERRALFNVGRPAAFIKGPASSKAFGRGQSTADRGFERRADFAPLGILREPLRITMGRRGAAFFTFRTREERIALESQTLGKSSFVHGDIWTPYSQPPL
jgi:hypothetical protein